MFEKRISHASLPILQRFFRLCYWLGCPTVQWRTWKKPIVILAMIYVNFFFKYTLGGYVASKDSSCTLQYYILSRHPKLKGITSLTLPLYTLVLHFLNLIFEICKIVNFLKNYAFLMNAWIKKPLLGVASRGNLCNMIQLSVFYSVYPCRRHA